MENTKSGKTNSYTLTKELEEHIRGLNEILKSLHRIAEDHGQSKIYSTKMGEIEKSLSKVKEETSNLINSIYPSAPETKQEYFRGPPVIIRCKQWEDFKYQAADSTAVSFLYKADEKAFQVDALKEGRVYTYSGQLPGDTLLLKTWLSKELNVEESKVMEGILGIG